MTEMGKRGLYDPAYDHDSCGVGFIVHLKGHRSHQLVQDGLTALENLAHRGASGSEPNTGDGAGLTIQLPDEFLRHECAAHEMRLPALGHYGTGIIFMSQDPARRDVAKNILSSIVSEEGQHLLGWRTVPTVNEDLGATALSAEPYMQQVFIARGPEVESEDAFERHLYVIRKRFEKAIERIDGDPMEDFYVASLSCRLVVYKGMLTAHQLRLYYPDLSDPRVVSALAMIHSRFSTNTFPSWKLSHPYRMIAHNGEINTLRGNINWMSARESQFSSPHFDDPSKLVPVIDEDGSDTACFDNALELLVMGGRPIEHAAMMLIPEAWQAHTTMSPEKTAFYEYHSTVMEPWDGPASIAFTDGRTIGAVLDRNGLRPSRYYVTDDDLVIMASEVGVLPIDPGRVAFKGRLEPGKMFLVSLEEGRIIDDAELKQRYSTAQPYAAWLDEHFVDLEDLAAGPVPEPFPEDELTTQQLAFGYSQEDVKYILAPMASSGQESLGSMGNDVPLAVLSDRPQTLFNYFKQLFAQVTNPPLDAIREELVTSVKTLLGPEGNLLDTNLNEGLKLLRLDTPFLGSEALSTLKAQSEGPFKAAVLPMLFPADAGPQGLRVALDSLFEEADQAISGGAGILVLSDRGVDNKNAPIPTLLATSALHHHLVRSKQRTQVGLVVETGEAREVHHFALLIGYGAGAVNPYLALESVLQAKSRGELGAALSERAVVENYLKALSKGVVKVMSKMGISTVQSYRGAQIFEAIGVGDEVIDNYFPKTSSRVGGIGLAEIANETLVHHKVAFPDREGGLGELAWGGQYQWRRDGERHLFNPDTVFKLQHATRADSMEVFREYTKGVDDQAEALSTLRGMFELKPIGPAVPLDEVEPAEEIFKRFASGAMSFGSIGAEAHETLAIAMNRIGGRSNTGEGGEDRRRFRPDANGDKRRSSIKQVASGRFGVTSEYLVNADEIQIKMAQGAKPGEGGQLPGHKVWPWIASVRHSTPGVGLISPPPHHDIYSIEDLAQLIHDLKNSNTSARISVKLVAEVGVGTVAAGVAKAKSDVVLISGYDGGTGASPLTSMKHAGGPWELGLAETHQVLVTQKLRDRIVVQVDGQMKTGRDVIVAALLGAEEYGFATAPLVVMGCVMMRVCHLDTCPVGIATQNPELRDRFSGQAGHVVNYFKFIAQEIREYMAELGFRTINEMIGRTDCIEVRPAVDHWKAQGVDFSAILYRPDSDPSVANHQVREQDHGIDRALDQKLLPLAERAVRDGEPVVIDMKINNTNRTVGTITGSEITRNHGFAGLPDGTLHVRFEGSAGQSFGAFVPPGMTLELEGDSNDYFGKGLSGGRLIVYPPKASKFVAEKNVAVGNVALYGATAGSAFVRGLAGERFGVRNSGALAVVEGTGDHACEYMTGGRVVVIGPTGRNFGAGMSGGVAFVWDPDNDFHVRCNLEMVGLEELVEEEDLELVHGLLTRHVEYTESSVGQRLLKNWPLAAREFVKVMPRDYRRVLDETSRAQTEGVEPELMRGAHG